MSGGHWDYIEGRLGGDLEGLGSDLRDDGFPLTAEALETIGSVLRDRLRDLDRKLSGDEAPVEDKTAADGLLFWQLFEPLLKICPDVWFPRGKWATIQAVQGRADESEPED